MKVAISVNNAAHQREHAQALQDGLAVHGIASVFVPGDTVVEDADWHACWSVKRRLIMEWSRRHEKPVLIMERGHVGDRMTYSSMGWNGLGRRGIYAGVDDGGKRWNDHWSHLMRRWKWQSSKTVLLIGQCLGDSSLYGLTGGFHAWAQGVTDRLIQSGYEVVYRPHPIMTRRGDRFCPAGAMRSTLETLSQEFERVGAVVTYNSTSGVEAVLYGLPAVTMDEGAMAWPVTTHDIGAFQIGADREPWAHRLAWTQFSLDEIRSGFAWEAVAPAMRKEVAA